MNSNYSTVATIHVNCIVNSKAGSRWRVWASEPFCWGFVVRRDRKRSGILVAMWRGRRLSSRGVRFLGTLGFGCPSGVAQPPRVTSWSGECRCGGFSRSLSLSLAALRRRGRQRRAVAGSVLVQLKKRALRPPSSPWLSSRTRCCPPQWLRSSSSQKPRQS